MSKVSITLPEFRKALKALGYKVKTKRNSSFIQATVTHVESGKDMTGNVYSADFLAQHKAYFDYRNGVEVKEDESSIAMRVIG